MGRGARETGERRTWWSGPYGLGDLKFQADERDAGVPEPLPQEPWRLGAPPLACSPVALGVLVPYRAASCNVHGTTVPRCPSALLLALCCPASGTASRRAGSRDVPTQASRRRRSRCRRYVLR